MNPLRARHQANEQRNLSVHMKKTMCVQVGETRTLYIPSALGYGEWGTPGAKTRQSL
jgi:hypothetical protein